jgi:outer membrane protein assembly factor BamB
MRYIGWLCLTVALPAADWPQWRGPLRDGKSVETGLLRAWPPGGPKLVWKAQGLGEGYSSIAIAAGRIYTLGQRGDTQYVMAFDEASGKKLWETAGGRAYRERRGDGPRSVPTVEGDRLWAFAADGTLSSLDARTGKRLWALNVTEKFGASMPYWGYSESPLVDGDRLYVVAGGRGASVVALDKASGAVLWKSQSEEAAYSSPILATVGNVKQLIVFTASSVLGLRADNGERLWRYDPVANRTANVATPIFHDNHVFVSSDYGTGCALLKLSPGGGATEVYFNREMRNHHASSILVDGVLYGFSSAVLTAMKLMTGEVLWRDRSVGKGSLTYADGLLFLLSEGGVLGLAEASPKGYQELARFTLPERSDRPTWAHPVIASGRLYVRDQDRLFAFAVTPK